MLIHIIYDYGYSLAWGDCNPEIYDNRAKYSMPTNITFSDALTALINNLPTMDPVSSGALWNSGGAIAISVVPVSYVAAGPIITHGGSTNTTVNVEYPAGIQADDVAFIMVQSESAIGTNHAINTPSGWNLVSEQSYTLSFIRQGLFYKRLTGNETGTVAVSTTIGGAAQDGHSAVMVIFRGCIATGTPYEGLATNTGNSVSMTGAAVTTIGSNRLLVDFGTHSLTTTITPAEGYIENLDVATTAGSDNGHTIQSKLVTSAQLYPAATHTISASSRWSVVSLALIPAIETSGGSSDGRGTTFPTSPSIDDVFYRTDRRIEYFWDGTRWLSTQLHTMSMPNYTDISNATIGTRTHSYVRPFDGQYDIFVADWQSQTYKTTGNWTVTLDITGSTAATHTYSGTNNTYNNQRTAINTVSSGRYIAQSMTTSGFGICSGMITYRVIG